MNGDANTKYFHIVVNSKIMNRRIKSLQDEFGIWQEDQQCLLTMAITYFSNLYQSVATDIPSFHWDNLNHATLSFD